MLNIFLLFLVATLCFYGAFAVKELLMNKWYALPTIILLAITTLVHLALAVLRLFAVLLPTKIGYRDE